tara:strand:- start:4612 stop:6303 length:1692 start_codon:yes stop_codon:yes gene_type:complete
MIKPNFIIIPKNCNAKELAQRFELKSKELNFTNLAISFNKKKRIKGILTLGDLRRILLKFGRYADVNKFLNISPIIVSEKNLNNKINSYLDERKIKKKLKKIDQLIILDKNKEITSIKNIEEIENNSFFKEITVIGMGHVGLPLTVHLLKNFSHLKGIEIDKQKIKNIKKNKLDFYEKNLDKALQKNIKNKNLQLSNNLNNVKSQIYIICLGSEIKKNSLVSNKNLIQISKSIGKKIVKNDLVILRGTVQVGTSRKVVIKLLEKYSKLKCGVDFYFSFLPERIIEGNALYELENVPQIVSGFTKKCREMALEFCSKAFKSIIELESLEEGEIIKLASNSYRDLSFAFSNEISRISSIYGLSGSNLIEKANFGYPRNLIAKPSMGVGGYCLPKDPFLFSKLLGTKKNGYLLAKNSRLINDNSINEVFNVIKNFQKYKSNKKNLNIMIFGITFKGLPETIDLRNSPSIELAKKLIKKNHKVKFYDVMYRELKKTKFKYSKYLINNKNFMNSSDVIIVANYHPDYPKMIQLNLKFNSSKNNKLIFDCWNLLDQQTIQNLNWIYKNI